MSLSPLENRRLLQQRIDLFTLSALAFLLALAALGASASGCARLRKLRPVETIETAIEVAKKIPQISPDVQNDRPTPQKPLQGLAPAAQGTLREIAYELRKKEWRAARKEAWRTGKPMPPPPAKVAPPIPVHDPKGQEIFVRPAPPPALRDDEILRETDAENDENIWQYLLAFGIIVLSAVAAFIRRQKMRRAL